MSQKIKWAELTTVQLEIKIAELKASIAAMEQDLHAARQALKVKRRNDTRAVERTVP